MNEAAEIKQSDDTNEDKDLLLRISERLCFFFSNANLRRDKFLQKIILEDAASSKGFVPIKTLLTFNTLKKITTDASKVIQTIKEDDECQSLFCLNESETAIGRIQPFTTEMITSTEYESRTIRIGNLPTVDVVDPTTSIAQKQYAVSIEEIQTLFSPYGKVAMVQLIFNHTKGHTRNPIGKAFVEFDSVEGYNAAVKELIVQDKKDTAEEGAEGDETKATAHQTLVIGGNALTVKTMEQHLEKQALKRASNSGKRSRKDQEDEEEKVKKEEEKSSTTEVPIDYTWQKDCVVHLQGLPETCRRETIIQVVTDFWGETIQVRADYQMGQSEGNVRFDQPHDKISQFVTALNEELLIDGTKVQAVLLQGEEEEKYHKNFQDFLQKRKQAKVDEARNKKQYRRNSRGRR